MSFDGWLQSALCDGRGKVHSVFAKAVAIDVQGWLVSLTVKERGPGPGFILMDDIQEKLKRWDLRPGDPVSIYNEGIQVSNKVEISLRPVASFDSRTIYLSASQFRADCFLSNLEVLRAFLQECGELIGGIIMPKELALPDSQAYVAVKMAEFIEAAQGRDLPLFQSAISKTIGLGWGLTPCCDDVLLGMMAANGFIIHFAERLPWGESRSGGKETADFLHEALPAAVIANLGKTGFVSGGFLRHAAEGRITGALQSLLSAIFSDDIKKKRRLLLDVQKTGASSGIDVMAGILLAFSLAGFTALVTS